MDYLITCACGHTLEEHGSHDGCLRCTCSRGRTAALEAAIETVKREELIPRP